MSRLVDDRIMMEKYLNKGTEEVIEEGLWDQMKARGAGIKGAAKGLGQRVAGAAKGAVAGVKGDVKGVQAAQQQQAAGKAMGLDAKSLSLVNSHLKNLNKVLVNFENDLSKLGMDPETIRTTNPEAAAALTSIKTALSTVTNSFLPGKARQAAVTSLQTKVKPGNWSASDPSTVGMPPQTAPAAAPPAAPLPLKIK